MSSWDDYFPRSGCSNGVSRFAFQTVAQVANEARVQPSTLVRFAKRFGFSGYSDLQQLFRLRLIEGERSFRDRTRDCQDRIEQAAAHDPSEVLNAMAAHDLLIAAGFSDESTPLVEAVAAAHARPFLRL